MKKTAFMDWVDGELRSDPRLAQDVDALLGEMKLEQDLVALREMRGLSQRDLARLLGASQPYVAKLESGRVRNLGVRTLLKCARAMGASLTIKIEPHRRPIRRKARARRR